MQGQLCKVVLATGLFSMTALAEEPMRIVTLAPHAAEMVFALGAGDWLVGTTEFSDYPEAAKAVPRVGGYHGMQIEKIVALQPDLVITWSGGNQPSDLAKLQKLGLPLYDSSPKTAEAVADDLIAIGQALGREAQAQQLADDYLQRLEQLRLTYADRDKVRVFYQLWHEPLMTVAKESWLDPLISLCGGSNVFHDNANPYPQISVENVVVSMPEAILLPQEQGAENSRQLWARWDEIPAVAKDQFYELDADLLHRTTPRLLDGVESLCLALDQVRQAR